MFARLLPAVMAGRVAPCSLCTVAPLALSLAGCADVVGADFEGRRLRNTRPVVEDVTLRVVEGTTNNRGRLRATDPDEDAIKYRILEPPKHGSVSLVDASSGEFVYAASADAAGNDWFTFQAQDGAGASATAGRVDVTIWPYEFQFDPEPRIGDTELGTSIAIEGKTALIGAEEKGAVYVAQQEDNGTWRCVQSIAPPEELGADARHFGWSVDSSGDWAIVSAWGNFPEDPEPWPPPPGKVFFYRRGDDGLFHLKQSFWGPESRVGDLFGMDVSVDGRRAVASAHELESVQTYELGADDVWVPAQLIPSPSGDPDDSFGIDTALEGDTLAISAPEHDEKANDAGAVYVFTWQGTWQLRQKLLPSGDPGAGYFMRAVAVSGDNLLAGASGASSGAGAAYVFERDATGAFGPTPKVLSYTNEVTKNFGWTVALHGDAALVGFMDRGTFRGGAVLFRKIGALWEVHRPLHTGSADGFSSSLAVHDRVVAVGAVSREPEGAAFFYNIPEPGTD